MACTKIIISAALLCSLNRTIPRNLSVRIFPNSSCLEKIQKRSTTIRAYEAKFAPVPRGTVVDTAWSCKLINHDAVWQCIRCASTAWLTYAVPQEHVYCTNIKNPSSALLSQATSPCHAATDSCMHACVLSNLSRISASHDLLLQKSDESKWDFRTTYHSCISNPQVLPQSLISHESASLWNFSIVYYFNLASHPKLTWFARDK